MRLRNWITLENIVRAGAVVAFGAALVIPMKRQALMTEDRFTAIATALEAYALDNGGKYPPHTITPSVVFFLSPLLSTPIAYLSPEAMQDPIAQTSQMTVANGIMRYVNFAEAYSNNPTLLSSYRALHGEWLIWSPGYDRITEGPIPWSGGTSGTPPQLYDPTNGVLSRGDMIRSQKMLKETGVINSSN